MMAIVEFLSTFVMAAIFFFCGLSVLRISGYDVRKGDFYVGAFFLLICALCLYSAIVLEPFHLVRCAV